MRSGSAMVLGCGMITAVGFSAPSTCAAIRSRISGFRETHFVAGDGSGKLIGAEVPFSVGWRGVTRLLQLIVGPVRECLESIPHVPPSAVPILLCVPEQ